MHNLLMFRFNSLLAVIFCCLYVSAALGDESIDAYVDVTNSSAPVFNENEINDLSCNSDEDNLNLKISNEKMASNREKLLDSIDARLINACAISPQDAKRRMLSSSIELIDIRSPEEFYSYSISGSMNLQPYAIKTLDSLKSKHLVLVGDKVSLIEMGLLCRELKEQGFKKVNFIKEGLEPWKDKLIGRDAKSVDSWDFGKIEPKEFVFLNSRMQWLVLDVSSHGSDKTGLGEIFDGNTVIAYDESGLSKVIEFTSASSNKSMRGLLVVSEHGEAYGDISKRLELNNITDVFYMDGGVSNYTKYLSERQVFLARLNRGPMIKRSCSNS